MNNLRKAAEQALEALEFDGFTPEDALHCHYTTKAITALRAALAQPEPLTDELTRAITQCNSWWGIKCKEMLASERETFVAIINDNTDNDGICCADDLLAAIRAHKIGDK